VVIDQPPVASFTVTPARPLVGQTVTFQSTATDADGTIAALDWDFTGSGLFADATGATVTKVFRQSGDAIVRLRVTDNRGVASVAAVTVPVGGPPLAAFGFSPASPTAGRPVTFTSASRDLDGAIVAQQWDLDGNGLFNDAAGGSVQHTFPFPGVFTVALRVTDTAALTDVAFQSVVVGAPAPAAAAAPPPRAAAPPRPAQPLLPFPIVRISGRVSGRSTRISLLEIRAPVGAGIRVKCKGRGCLKRDLTAVATRAPVRFPRMRRRLSAGAVVEVFIRANGRIGKYTRFRIRKGRAPLRRDMCLPPTTRGPAPCTG
jgi:plastocyanin